MMILERRRFVWPASALFLLAGPLLLITGCKSLIAPANRSRSAKAPKVIVVEATYPGASAQVLAETVASLIEQQVNGADNLVQMLSRCTNDGKYTLLLRFKPDVDVLQTALGSAEAGDFTVFGQSGKLRVALAPSGRERLALVKHLKVRSGEGQMVPLASLVTLRETEGPQSIDRLDLRPAMQISANPARGVSLAQARWLCETLAQEVRKELQLSPEYALVWLQELPPPREIPGAAKAGAKPEVPEVVVRPPVVREITDYENFTGRAEAAESVEVHARVSGYIAESAFKEGAQVKKGDVLFRLDARTYKADLDQAVANLKLALAERTVQERAFARARKLLAASAISKEDFDLAVAELDRAKAKAVAMQATRDRAALFVDYTQIKSPITGRIGRRRVDPGNLVLADTTLLTTIVVLDPINVSFEMDERTLLHLTRLAQKKGTALAEANLPVLVGLADEKGYARKGVVKFVSNRVDATTGAVTARAVLANRDETIKPGMFVRVRLSIGSPRKALLVPDEAIRSDLGRKVVYVVDEQNRVISRRVAVGTLHDSLRVIEEGLTAEDRVVTDGHKRLRPGMKVRVAEDRKTGR